MSSSSSSSSSIEVPGPPGGANHICDNVKDTMTLLLSIFKKQIDIVTSSDPNKKATIEYNTDALDLGFDICDNYGNQRRIYVFQTNNMYFARLNHSQIVMLCASWDKKSCDFDKLNNHILTLCKYALGYMPPHSEWRPTLNFGSPLDLDKNNGNSKCSNLAKIFMSVYGAVPGKKYRFYSIRKYENAFNITLISGGTGHNGGERQDQLYVGFINNTTILIRKIGNNIADMNHDITIICDAHSLTTGIVAKLQKLFDYTDGWLNSLVLD
jgi:hypothetical protein